jgi:hypothetical protein
VEFEYLVNDW